MQDVIKNIDKRLENEEDLMSRLDMILLKARLLEIAKENK